MFLLDRHTLAYQLCVGKCVVQAEEGHSIYTRAGHLYIKAEVKLRKSINSNQERIDTKEHGTTAI